MTTADRSSAIRAALAPVNSPVRLVFFEQSIGCDACTPTRQLIEQIADLNPHIAIDVLNLVLEKDRAAHYGIDRVPAIVVSSPGRDRIRFYGSPVGHELMSLLEAIRMTAEGDSGLTDGSRAQLATVRRPVTLLVFFTPSCTFCPQMVNLANQLALENPHITATAIDATSYPDLVRRYNVNGVPKTVINDAVGIVGATSEAQLIDAVVKLNAG
ncbi:MAG: thioredoxin family protein [Vulcanimicrobiaceae bacterium]